MGLQQNSKHHGFLIQGTTEEIVCRGYVQGRITEKLGVFWAIALSALFFASGHLGNAGVSLEGFVGSSLDEKSNKH